MRKGWWALVWLIAAMPVWASEKGDFEAAREAYRQGNLQKVAELTESLGDSVLGIYPRYWLLSAQLEKVSPEQVLPFLNYYQKDWLTEKLRGDWLRVLGKRGDWALFREQYPLLVDGSSMDLRCYYFRSRLERGESGVLAEAKADIWFTSKDLPAACDFLLQRMKETDTLTWRDVRQRLRLALEANVQGLARAMAERMGTPVSARDLQAITSDPAGWLKKNSGGSDIQGELAVFALGRLSRPNPDEALNLLRAWQPRLSENQKLYAWRRMAVVAATFQQDPRTLEWFANSEGIDWQDNEVEWRLRMALREQNWDTVQKSLQLLSENKKQERVWQYWRARMLENRKETVAANTIYARLSADDDYYGLLSRERVGPMAGVNRPLFKPDENDKKQALANAGLKRALLLRDMDLRTESMREWNWTLRGADDRLLIAAAEIARDAGWYDRAIYAAERTTTLHNYDLRYLAPFRDVTRRYAQTTGLDEAWVFGLMRQESRFVAVAKSGVGAGGLMQLMPDTARWVAKKLNIRYEPTMVNDAGTNVQLGTYYLRHVLDSLASQPVLATAGYNAGPGRAKAWQKTDAPMEAAVYVESIGFSETRDYVKKVMTNAVHYAQAFGQGPQSLTARLGTIPARNPAAIEGP